MTKIYVGNLPETCRRTDLLALFEKYGKVTECDIIKNYGFVHMETEQDAKAAIDGLHEYNLEGTQISVELSHSKVRTKPGVGGKGQCYKCGRSGHWSKDCPRGPTRGRRDGGYGEPPIPPPMPGYRDRLYGRYPPPDRMRPYPDPYERRPMPPPDREYFRSRSPFGAPRYPPSDYYYHRRSPPRFASDDFMRFEFDPFESRGRSGFDEPADLYEKKVPDRFRQDEFREDGFRDVLEEDDFPLEGFRRERFRPDGFQRDGFRPDGFQRDGFRPDGFQREGFQREGFQREGFQREGFRPEGFQREGFRPDGFQREGFGFRDDGFQRDGFRPFGFRRDDDWQE